MPQSAIQYQEQKTLNMQVEPCGQNKETRILHQLIHYVLRVLILKIYIVVQVMPVGVGDFIN